MTSNLDSFHHKVNKIMQTANLTQPACELHIQLWTLLVPERDRGSASVTTTGGSARICSAEDIFQTASIVSDKAEDRGGYPVLETPTLSPRAAVTCSGHQLFCKRPRKRTQYASKSSNDPSHNSQLQLTSLETERGMEATKKTCENTHMLKPTAQWWLPWVKLYKESWSFPSYVEGSCVPFIQEITSAVHVKSNSSMGDR